MKKAVFILLWLLLGGLSARAQDKELALLDGYARLAGHIEAARSAYKKDNVGKCEREVLYCLHRLPEHQEAHFLMSGILSKRGEYGKALEHIRAAEAGFVKWIEAVDMVQLRKQKRQAEKAAMGIDSVIAAAADEAAAIGRGSCQVPTYSRAVEVAKEALAKSERTDDLEQDAAASRIPAAYRLFHGNALFKLGRLPEAETEYRLAIEADPGCAEAYNNLINILFAAKRLDEARALLSQAEARQASIHPGLRKAVLESDGK